jgi:hypothetical protein
MTEEHPSQVNSFEGGNELSPAGAAHQAVVPDPGAAPEAEPKNTQPESEARALLRDAIAKVMREIEHHEAEAQRHAQQAATLRKELRESIAYLRKQGEQRETPAAPVQAAPGEPTEQMLKQSLVPRSSESRRRRGRAKHKRAARKAT